MSKNGIGVAVIVIEAVLSLFGINLPEGTALSFVEAVVVIGSIALLVWNQLQRHDVVAFFFKK